MEISSSSLCNNPLPRDCLSGIRGGNRSLSFHLKSAMATVGVCPTSGCSWTRSRSLTLGERNRCRVMMADSMNLGESYSSLTVDRKVSAVPVYEPTPPDRELRTPHSGYHFDGCTRRFFEGWYFKISIPDKRQSFCFMYSVENPAFPDKLGPLDETLHGHRFTGVGAQILGADDKYICQFSEKSNNFWGIARLFFIHLTISECLGRHELILGNTFKARQGSLAPKKRAIYMACSRRFSGQPYLASRFYT
ncbi:tocopherol cyclase, chloroplastic-like isoform X2 [Aristolochia californica]|uniref:tocopherol cyclase, chloroplastic-like isoform X2 n=1 Tax=Aristolochia californica TaxID=171875 RepID=UPI0035E1B7E8